MRSRSRRQSYVPHWAIVLPLCFTNSELSSLTQILSQFNNKNTSLHVIYWELTTCQVSTLPEFILPVILSFILCFFFEKLCVKEAIAPSKESILSELSLLSSLSTLSHQTVRGVRNFLGSVSPQQNFDAMGGPVLQLHVIAVLLRK